MGNRSVWLVLVAVVFATVLALAAYYNRAQVPEPTAGVPAAVQPTPPAAAPAEGLSNNQSNPERPDVEK